MAPTLKRFLPIRGRVTTISRERNDLLFLGTSQRDIGQGMRSILVDLVYSNVLRRGAIRCNILATVIEIARYFTSWRIPIDSPLLATFQLYWHDGSSWRVFQAFEVPTIPEGSFVQIVQASSPCSQYLITPPDPTLRVNPGRGDGGGRSRRPPEYYAIPDRISWKKNSFEGQLTSFPSGAKCKSTLAFSREDIYQCLFMVFQRRSKRSPP